MDSIILYTIHCPACNVLEKKLKSKNISFEIVDDEEILNKLNIVNFPVMSLNGSLLSYREAIEWINLMEKE